MHALQRLSQLKTVRSFRHGLGRFLTRHWPEGGEEQLAVTEWSPLVDISEDDKEYRIQAELPDVKKEDVRVKAEAGRLTIRGERKFSQLEPGRRYHRVERAYGSFGRCFALPEDAKPTEVTAEFKEGVLTIHLLKDEKDKTAPQLNVDIV